MNILSSPRVVRVLDRLFSEADASEPAMDAAVAGTDVSAMITSRTGYREFYGLLKKIPLPVSRETGALLYMLVRATRAQSVLEFGTSFGVSTTYLAAALCDNGGGRVITTEFEASKVDRARKNLTEAGLIDLVEIREGDALQTLARDLPETLDVVLLDGAKALYTDVLALVEPRLRPGSLVLADDARHCTDFVNGCVGRRTGMCQCRWPAIWRWRCDYEGAGPGVFRGLAIFAGCGSPIGDLLHGDHDSRFARRLP